MGREERKERKHERKEKKNGVKLKARNAEVSETCRSNPPSLDGGH